MLDRQSQEVRRSYDSVEFSSDFRIRSQANERLLLSVMVGGRPDYPAEVTEETEIIDECEDVTSDCEEFSATVGLFSLYLRIYLHLTFRHRLLVPTRLPSWPHQHRVRFVQKAVAGPSPPLPSLSPFPSLSRPPDKNFQSPVWGSSSTSGG